MGEYNENPNEYVKHLNGECDRFSCIYCSANNDQEDLELGDTQGRQLIIFEANMIVAQRWRAGGKVYLWKV